MRIFLENYFSQIRQQVYRSQLLLKRYALLLTAISCSTICQILLQGCSGTDISPQAPIASSPPVPHQAAASTEKPLPLPTNEIEILWAIPEDPVDGFIIAYGTLPTQLTQRIRIDSKTIERYKDSEFGEVYRYTIKNVPAKQHIYVSIIAFNGNQESEPSEVFEATAN